MSCVAVVGLQWGDEGKGKIVDVLSEDADVIARYQGGPNAGHTVVIRGSTFVLHLVPTGILRSGKTCVIGNGVVIDPESLWKEIDSLEERGVSTAGRLFLSNRAHIITSYHRAIESIEENARCGGPLGTTGKGIGPAYCDKVARKGIRIIDLYEPAVLADKVHDAFAQFARCAGESRDRHQVVPPDELIDQLLRWSERLAPMVADTSAVINDSLDAGKKVLLEGAQGILLDVDHGTYPYVTSSSAGVGGACAGLGLAPGRIDAVTGVAKAYVTRVGNGPFPTECSEAEARFLREEGGEYGATTGRPRRCGWFDAVACRYAARLSGLKSMAITKLDVLDRLERIGVCTAYMYRGERHEQFSPSLTLLSECTPEIEYLDGWMTDTKGARSLSGLPRNARVYVEKLEELTRVPVTVVSVGQDRDQTLSVEGHTLRQVGR